MSKPETEFIENDASAFGGLSGQGLDAEGRPIDGMEEDQAESEGVDESDTTMNREERLIVKRIRLATVVELAGGAALAGILLYSGFRGESDDQGQDSEIAEANGTIPAESTNDTSLNIDGMPARPESVPRFGDGARDTTIESGFGVHQLELTGGKYDISLECASGEGFVVGQDDNLYDLSIERLGASATQLEQDKYFAAAVELNVAVGNVEDPDLIFPNQEVALPDPDTCIETTFITGEGEAANTVQEVVQVRFGDGILAPGYKWVLNPETGELENA